MPGGAGVGTSTLCTSDWDHMTMLIMCMSGLFLSHDWSFLKACFPGDAVLCRPTVQLSHYLSDMKGMKRAYNSPAQTSGPSCPVCTSTISSQYAISFPYHED